jgi:hypothetical protein
MSLQVSPFVHHPDYALHCSHICSPSSLWYCPSPNSFDHHYLTGHAPPHTLICFLSSLWSYLLPLQPLQNPTLGILVAEGSNVPQCRTGLWFTENSLGDIVSRAAWHWDGDSSVANDPFGTWAAPYREHAMASQMLMGWAPNTDIPPGNRLASSGHIIDSYFLHRWTSRLTNFCIQETRNRERIS